MNQNILLVEPDYPNKFPPLGLMKISAYHKDKGDYVVFTKGLLKKRNFFWDRIYITTLFSLPATSLTGGIRSSISPLPLCAQESTKILNKIAAAVLNILIVVPISKIVPRAKINNFPDPWISYFSGS